MDRLNVDSPFTSVSSCFQDSSDVTVIPPDDSSPMPSMTGHYVRKHDPPQKFFLVDRLFNQVTLPSPCSLNDFSISYSPLFEKEIMRPDLYSPEPPDEIFSCDHSCTDPTLTNAEKTAHQLPPKNPLADLSQPSSRSETTPDLLHKDTQEQVITATIESKTHESCSSEEPLPLTHAEAHKQSGKRKADEKGYTQPKNTKAYKKTYRESKAGKARIKAYRDSDKGKASIKAYRGSCKGKASLKAYSQSRKRKSSKQNWAKSEKGKAYMKAYRKAYNSVMNEVDGNREKARIAGKAAAAIILDSYRAMKK
ncbi:hypothetical protein [Endozoicomonas acroporae]|uniref:hypothetical protein n=1 Tax=Endozoicomonas acroporae TaxID=1701104 RepID=UPI003D7ADCE5